MAIRAFPGFLLRSEEILCLVDDQYLRRTWCVYELAAYTKLRPRGKVRIVNVYQRLLIFWLFILQNFNSIFFANFCVAGFIFRNISSDYTPETYGSASNALEIFGRFVILATYTCIVKSYFEHEDEFMDQAKHFDVRNTESSNPTDTLFLLNCVGNLYDF